MEFLESALQKIFQAYLCVVCHGSEFVSRENLVREKISYAFQSHEKHS